MKTLKYFKIYILILVAAFTVSCVQDDEFDVPNLEVTPPELEGSFVTIGALKQLLLQAQPDPDEITDVLTIEEEIYTTGYVISNDEFGNLYKEIIIQDEKENPSIGIKVLIDLNPVFAHFEFGRKIHIQLKGLTIGMDSGVLTIGDRNANSVDEISFTQINKVKKDVDVVEIVALPMNISDFDNDKTNLFIRLNDVQFNRNEVLGEGRKTFSAEPEDEFDGERQLESCSSQSSTIFSTSTFADFSAVLLPQGRGTLDGILTMDFFGEVFNIVVNSPESIYFENEDRCDPDFFFCESESGGGSIFYNENFEAHDSIEEFIDEGWTNVNTSNGNTVWEIGNFSNNNYAQITGFNSGEDNIDTWLVTPAINMDNTSEEELVMDIQASYDNGTILTVLISTNFAGDVTTATWEILDVTIPVGPSGGFGVFETIDPVNISCADGNIHIAFFYEGSDSSATTRYHIDNIKITGN